MQARVKKLVNGQFLAQTRTTQYSVWKNIELDDGFEWSEDHTDDCICDTYEEALDALAMKGVGFEEMQRDAEEIRKFPSPEPDKIFVVEPTKAVETAHDDLLDDLKTLREEIVDSWKPKPSKTRIATETFITKVRTKFQNIWKDICADWKRVRNKP